MAVTNKSTMKVGLGYPSEARIKQIEALNHAERQAFKATLDYRVRETVPLGPYPCKFSSVGWCQIELQPDTCEARYIICGMYKGIDVKVESKQANGKVAVWGRSEFYVPQERCMKLQPANEGWRQQITCARARQIILAAETNWLRYKESMAEITTKELAKWNNTRKPPRKSPSGTAGASALLSLRDTRGGHRTKEQQARRDAVTRVKKQLKFPKSTEDEETPAKKKSRKDSEPEVPARKGPEPVKTPATKVKFKPSDAAKKKLQAKQQLVRKIINRQRGNTQLEQMISSPKVWAKRLKDSPDYLLAMMLRLLNNSGDSEQVLMAALRMINKSDVSVRREEAEYWKELVAQKIRSVVTANNNALNKLQQEVTDLQSMYKFKEDPPVIELDQSDDNDFEQDVATPNKSKGPTPTKKDKGTSNKAKGPARSEAAKEGSASAIADFKKADADYYTTRQIPKTDTTKKYFRECYPRGYPDDEDFKMQPHYLVSKRTSMSGFKHVMVCDATRDQRWRVKYGGKTIGRYVKKAHACEDAYWISKQARQMAEFGKADTIPSAMFE